MKIATKKWTLRDNKKEFIAEKRIFDILDKLEYVDDIKIRKSKNVYRITLLDNDGYFFENELVEELISLIENGDYTNNEIYKVGNSFFTYEWRNED